MVRLVIDGAAKVATLRSSAIARINARAGAARARFVTIAAGQEMIYLAKEAEAHRFRAAPTADLSTYPFLAAEVGITAPTPAALADVWATAAAQWRAIGAMIEQARLGAIATVEGGTAAQVIEEAVATFDRAAAAVEDMA